MNFRLWKAWVGTPAMSNILSNIAAPTPRDQPRGIAVIIQWRGWGCHSGTLAGTWGEALESAED